MANKRTKEPVPGSLRRLVRHHGENQNGPSNWEIPKRGIIANLLSGKCGLQSLLGLFGVLICRESKNRSHVEILRQRPGLQELYSLWQSIGRPTSGLWHDIVFVDHAAGCSCDAVMSNDKAEAQTPDNQEQGK